MLDDILKTIFKNAYPESSDEDIQNQVEGLKAAGSDAVNKALSFIPGASSAKDIVSNAKPLANEAMKSPTIQNVASGLSSGLTGPMRPSPDAPIPDQTDEVPGPSPEDLATPMPSSASSDTSKQPIAPKLNKAVPALTATDLVAPTNDNATRQEELATEKKKYDLGTIPVALAGIGDAVSAAGKPFGGEATTGSANKVAGELEKGTEQRKAQSELDLKNDPNSTISRHYQKVLSLMTGNKVSDVSTLSASQIAESLPQVEKYMQKELQMHMIKENKNISLGLKEDQQQDKLEQQYKQQLMSVRGDPNISGLEKQRDAAAQGYNLLLDAKQPNGDYNLSEPQLVELYGQLYQAMTGRGLTAESQKAMDQATAKGKWAAIGTFLGMSPSATTKAIGDRLIHMTTTVGSQAQTNIDKRMESRILPPSGLKSERVDPIRKAGRGFTFQELMEESKKKKQGGSGKSQDPLGIL